MNIPNLKKMCELLMTHNGSMFSCVWEHCSCREYRKDHNVREHFISSWKRQCLTLTIMQRK